MKSVSYEEFKAFNPCWLETEQGRQRLKRYGKQRERWTALDILALKRVPAADRLWAVLREELLEALTLHEFSCRCAESALSKIQNPDPRSAAAIQAKRDWLQGKISDKELTAAQSAAEAAVWATEAAAWSAARAAAEAAARAAAEAAAQSAARAAAWATTEAAARSAAAAATEADEEERLWQVNELNKLIHAEDDVEYQD